MDLFIAIALPIILLIGFTFLFMTYDFPSWIINFTRNSSNIWNFGIIAMTTITIVIYSAKK